MLKRFAVNLTATIRRFVHRHWTIPAQTDTSRNYDRRVH